MLSSMEKVHPLLSSYIIIHPHICLDCFCLSCTYFPSDSDMTFFPKTIEIQRWFTPILMNGRKCNAQYGGIVPPSKWKSQSLIGKLELRMRIGWSRPKNKHLPQHSWGSLYQILLLIWICNLIVSPFLRFQDSPIHLDRTWSCLSCPEALQNGSRVNGLSLKETLLFSLEKPVLLIEDSY